MARTRTPEVLWSDCIVMEAEIISHTAKPTPLLNGLTPQSLINTETPDISRRIAEFEWYSWIWWHDQGAPFPQPKKTLGHYLGPTKDIGPILTAKILKSNGKIVARSSFTAVSADEMEQPNIKENIAKFTLNVNNALRPKVTVKGLKDEKTPDYLPYSDCYGQEESVTIPDRDDYDVSTYDPYLHSQVNLPHEGRRSLQR